MIHKGASALVLNDKGEVLITKRQDLHRWVFPGGQVDEGEIPQEAVRREVEEETGIKIKVKRLAGIHVLDHFLRKSIGFFFLAQKIGGKERRQKGEVLEIRWVNPKELKRLVSKRHYQKYQVAVSSDKRVRLIIQKRLPISLSQLPVFLWRRTLGKKLSLVKV